MEISDPATTITANAAAIAACGLYCGACRKFIAGKCPGCFRNEKASWCGIRSCCIEHGYRSCADCPPPAPADCRKFNNFVGKVFALLFRSDRSACIRRIREAGYESYAREMRETGKMTLRRR